MAQCSAVSVCTFWTWCYELLHVPPIQLVHLRPVFSVNHLARIFAHAACRTQRCFKTASDASRCFHFSRFATPPCAFACRILRILPGYESTLSPTHLMQQLLAFVHPLLKSQAPTIKIIYLSPSKNKPQTVLQRGLPTRGLILFKEHCLGTMFNVQS